MTLDLSRDFLPVRIALLTVSDTRTLGTDRSGDILEARVKKDGHALSCRRIVKDDRAKISEQLLKFSADPEVDAVISTGGYRLDWPGRHGGGSSRRLRKRNRRVFRHVHVGLDEVHRDFGRSVESLRGRFERNLSVRFAGIARRVQGCVG